MNSETFYKINYGVYIVSSKMEEKFNAQIANTVVQITADPPKIIVSINQINLTHEFIQKTRKFSVSILSRETPLKYIGRFGFNSGKSFDKFKGVNYKMGKIGIPIILEHTIGYLECEVVNSLTVDNYTIFIAKVIEAEILKEEQPLTYSYYREIKKGATPKTAPSYSENQNKKEKKKMGRYRCKICGYIYDPEQGDPTGGIEPGTKFEDLPKDWVCPVCGVTKDKFEKIN